MTIGDQFSIIWIGFWYTPDAGQFYHSLAAFVKRWWELQILERTGVNDHLGMQSGRRQARSKPLLTNLLIYAILFLGDWYIPTVAECYPLLFQMAFI